jgi:proteasome accessory factor B
MPDNPALLRQWLILNQLSARRNGATVRELADEHGASIKTIRRDIDALRRVGFQLEERVIEQGCKVWKLGGNHSAALGFNLTEAMALYLGRRFLEPLAGTHFWEGAQSAFRKIQATLGEQALGYLEKLAGIFYQTTFGSDYRRKGDIIDALVQAIEDRRLTELHYQSQRATEPVEYEIHPYAIAYHAGALYLVAWSADHREIRHFKIDRIEDAHPTQIQFPRPPDFDVTEHFAGSLGVFHGSHQNRVTVRVRFSKAVSRYVQEHRRHKSQRVVPQKDGSVAAEFQLTDLEELKHWLLSFGATAKVLEPPELVADLRHEIEAMMQLYRPSPDCVPQHTMSEAHSTSPPLGKGGPRGVALPTPDIPRARRPRKPK